MKKTIKLTEKDLTNLIKKVISEDLGDEMSLDTVEVSVEEQKAKEILKYMEFEVRGWLFDKNKRVTQETPGYFLENNSKMVDKITNILRK
tara:strand:+ start:747 stop:1016 length:270 start_codon:yes stop_codon:yes gene_type:complete